MVYLECKPDEALARSLGVRRRDISHQRNKEQVLKTITRVTNCIALVDEDPNSLPPPLFGQLLRQEDSLAQGILLYLDRRRNNQVIVLCPNLEGWVIRSAQESHILHHRPPYRLPEAARSLHNIINDRLPSFRHLIADLLAAKSPRILKLQELLTS